MDPSSNNSFGSFSSGGISGGNDFVGGEQPVDNGLNVATNSAVTDNGGAATNDFGAQVPRASDAGAGVFGATGIAPGAAVNASVGVGAASAPAPQAQPQMTQMQFSTQPQFPMRPQVVVSGTGDVVLGGVEPKKSKKWLVAIIVIVVIGIAAAWMGMFLSKKSVDNDKYTDVSFEEFVNYVAVGDTSANYDVSAFNAMQIYAIDDFFEKSGTEEAAGYFERLNELWQSFAKRQDFSTSNWNGAGVIGGDVEILAMYMRSVADTEEVLLRQYIGGGEEALYVYGVSYYGNDDIALSGNATSYMAFWDDYIKSLAGLFKSYIENGCVVNNEIDYGCVANKGIYSQDVYKQLEFTKENLADCAADIEYEVKWRIEKISTFEEEVGYGA